MHLLVTDRLACAHCGPDFGLVLVADRIESRRVLDGFFGCANCQARYPVRDGFGYFRTAEEGAGVGPSEPVAPSRSQPGVIGPVASPDPEEATRLAALLGLTAGTGFLLAVGRAVPHSGALSLMADGFEVLGAAPGLDAEPESEGLSRLAFGPRLPLRSKSLRGVILEGSEGLGLLPEAGRALAPGARLVLLDPPGGAGEAFEKAGQRVLAQDETAVVSALK